MIRFAASALTALSLLAAPVAAEMTEDERAEFRAEVRAYLLENPEVIMEAVAILEQREAAAEAQADQQLVSDNAEALFNDGFSYVGGNPDGDITLVEFMDYRCGYCRKAAPEVEALLKADGNIRLIIKEYPILGDASVISARFAIAAKHIGGAEAYKSAHDALIGFRGEVNEITLGRLAQGLGLDGDAILAAMDSQEVDAELRATRELGRKLKISGTPSFVLGEELLRGYLPASQMQLIAEDQRDNRG